MWSSTSPQSSIRPFSAMNTSSSQVQQAQPQIQPQPQTPMQSQQMQVQGQQIQQQQQQFQQTHIQPQLMTPPAIGTTIRAHNSYVQMVANKSSKDFQKPSSRVIRDTIEDEKESCLRYFAEREAFIKDGRNVPEKFRPPPQTTVGVCFSGHYGAPWCPEVFAKNSVSLTVKISTDPNTGEPTIGFNDLSESVPLATPTARRFLDELNMGILSASTAELIEELQHHEPGSMASACVEVHDYREIFSADSSPRVTRVQLKSAAPRASKRKNKSIHDLNISESYALVNK